MSNLDPLDRERTDESPKSDLISKRDIKAMAIALVVIAIILVPIYTLMRRNADKYHCGKNMESIGKAILEYAADYDDHLPPVSYNDGAPSFDPFQNQLLCWADIPAIHGRMKKDTSFVCPSAEKEEAVTMSGEKTLTEPLTYGMYQPYGSIAISSIESPAESVMVGETSNAGAHDTYDPVPFLDASGQPVRSDGYVIGWDTSNTFPGAQTRYATRLAYYGSKGGKFAEDGPARHDGTREGSKMTAGIYFVTASGGRLFREPSFARVFMDKASGRPYAPWRFPFTYASPGR